MEVDLIMAAESIDLQVPNIEKELNQGNGGSKAGKGAKACLFNLIIYGHEERRVKYLEELVESILDKFPCRIIFIQANKTSPTSYFRVKVSNVLSGQASGAGVSCDQIIIEASQDQLMRVPFLINAHMVPDLPVYLLWGQNPFEEREIFPHLQGYAKRVIFDSECADDLGMFCKEMQTNLEALKMDVMDINWALVSNWRDVLGEIFDSPEKLQHLQDCKSIIIQYNACKTKTALHPEARALYLQGWLASAFNWKYKHVERFQNDVVISYLGTKHPVIVGLSPQHIPTLPLGAVMSIEITTADHHHYFVARKDGLQQVDVHISSKDTCELPFTLALPNIHKGLSFMREIFFSSLGDHYRQTLKSISDINLNVFTEE
jgi:glucose-6-phosphate dehydrogenase assembly protein OpcA